MSYTTIASTRRIRFSQFVDDGVLTVFPATTDVPFPISRVFTISGVSAGGKRGNHAHRWCTQLVCSLSGRLAVDIDDGFDRTVVELVDDGIGLLVPPWLWYSVIFDGPASVLAVFCDIEYSEADYVRDRSEFERAKARQTSAGES